MSQVTFRYPLFDGEKVIENASVTMENGIITAISRAEDADSSCLLMPGLIDSHTHITSEEQIGAMLTSGIAATCDVCAPAALVAGSRKLQIISSAGMAMGPLNGREYVKKTAESGAKYTKVLLFEPHLMSRDTLCSICQAAHERSLKVAVHATSVTAERLAVECGADILLHVPLKEALPGELAQEIAQRGVAVAPTLVMMETFAHSGRNGYLPEHYRNAENAVRTLHACGVTILAGTDANVGSFSPAVAYGTSLHRETELLCKAGLTPAEVLASATGNAAKAFGLQDHGCIAEGKRARLILTDGRPDKDITALRRIRQMWIDGELL